MVQDAGGPAPGAGGGVGSAPKNQSGAGSERTAADGGVPVAPRGRAAGPTMEAVKKLVREEYRLRLAELGLKEGQRLDAMITGASRKAVRDVLGVPKETQPVDHFKAIFSEVLKRSDLTGGAPDGGPPEVGRRLRAQEETISSLKETVESMFRKVSAAEEEARESRRRELVRDALGRFKVLPEAHEAVLGMLVHGVGGAAPAVLEGDGCLYALGAEGDPKPYGDYLKEFFTSHGWALAGHGRKGSGATGGTPWMSNAHEPERRVDFSRKGMKTTHAAYAADPEGTARAIQAASEAKARGIW